MQRYVPCVFRVVITTRRRGARSASLQCGDPLTMIGRARAVQVADGGVSPGQKLADPVSLSLFREVEDVVAYATDGPKSDQI